MLSFYQQYWSEKIINNCCDTGNGADIELIIVKVAISACLQLMGVARGVVSNINLSLMCFGVS